MSYNHRLSFAWIDDTERRQRLLTHLVESAPVGIKIVDKDFVFLKAKEQPDLIKFLARRSPPSLILVDQVLNKCEWELKIPLLGSSLAEIMRQKWPACPIIGVTAGQNITEEGQWYDYEKRAEFEELIEDDNFGRSIELIYAVALGFETLTQLNSITVKKIVALLEPPTGEKERLATAVPDEIRTSMKDKSIPRLIAMWVRRRLMGRPGFLYDREWTANLLGLNPKGFNKVEALFAGARYSGIFSEESNPRWWGLALKEMLFHTVTSPQTSLMWVEGQRLNGLNQSDFSVCYVCKQPHPELMGYIDTSSHERRPMHIRCTIADPRFQSVLYHDDIRAMKG